MAGYRALDNDDKDEALALLMREPEHNLITIHNIREFGMDSGEGMLQADYFGRYDGTQLLGIGALYGVGALFVYARSDEAVPGMGDYLVDLGKVPSAIDGRRSLLEVLMDDLGGRLLTARRLLLADEMVLRSVSPGVSGEGARPAAAAEMDTLVEMQGLMETEVFGEPSHEDALREIIKVQLASGGVFLIEADGRVVSKASATIVPVLGAQVGGVYTVQEYRGRGYSTNCVGALCRRLLGEVGGAVLSVVVDNYAARGVYHKIGFEKVDDWLIVVTEEV